MNRSLMSAAAVSELLGVPKLWVYPQPDRTIAAGAG